MGLVVNCIITAAAGLPAGHGMHVENRINLIFLTPDQDIVQHREGILIPLIARLLQKEGRRIQHETHGIVAKFSHPLNIFLLHEVPVPSGPEILRVLSAAEFPDQKVHGTHAVQLFRLIVISGKCCGSADHKALRVHPVSRAIASENDRFTVFIHYFSSFSMKKSFYTVLISITQLFVLLIFL